jgi:hypothetical protein
MGPDIARDSGSQHAPQSFDAPRLQDGTLNRLMAMVTVA